MHSRERSETILALTLRNFNSSQSRQLQTCEFIVTRSYFLLSCVTLGGMGVGMGVGVGVVKKNVHANALIQT